MKVAKQDFSEPAKNKPTEIFAQPLANDVEPVGVTTSSTPTRRLSRWRFFVGVGVYCVVIVAGGKYLISKVGHYNTKTQVVPQISRNINTTGNVVPQKLLTVLPQATDLQIKQVLVKEGDTVKAGQLMAVLDDSVLQTQIDQARGLLKSSEAVVIQKQAAVLQAQADIGKAKAVLVKTQAQAGELKALMIKAEAQLDEAQANLAKAKSERNRYQFLAGEETISVQDLESSSTDATAFEEQVRSAHAEIERVQAEFESVQAEVDSYRAGVSAAQANLSNAQADLKSAQAIVSSSLAQIQQLQTARSRTLLRAPANGLVMEKIAQVGDVTSFDRKLFSLARNSSFVLQVKLEEYQLPNLRIGTPVLVTSDSDKRIRLQGKVREISPVVDSQTYQPIVRIDLPPSTLLRSGMVLRAAITSANPNKPKLTSSK